MRGSHRLLLLGAVLAGIWTAGPVASAVAAIRYVDDTGTGVSPCTNQNLPCPAIATALTASASGDVIHVGGGAYPGNIALPDGISLVKDSFATVPPANTAGTATVNTTGNANPAVTVSAGTAPRTISGFTLRGGNSIGKSALLVAVVTNVTIAGNTFDDASANVSAQLRLSGGSPLVSGNSFTGASDGVIRFAIGYNSGAAGAPEIAGNTISNFFEGMQIIGAQPSSVSIHDNTITSIHQAGMAIPIGIDVNPGSGTIRRNLISSAPSPTLGIGILVSTGASVAPLNTSDNQVYGFPEGVEFGSGSVPISLDNSVLGNNQFALADYSTGQLTATNNTMTSTGSSYEIYMGNVNAKLALNSSFVGSAGVGVQTNGATCTSSFSVTTHAPVCGMTQIADPMFTNAPANDFSLLSASPLIDAGDPATPAFATDVAGNPRALAIHSCPDRRDIGAYEFATGPLNCSPPPAQPAAQPPATKKKCKKHKKKRSAEAAKKRRCKKRKPRSS